MPSLLLYVGKKFGYKRCEVPVGKFSIDETILVPKDDFSNVTWQCGPSYDKDMSSFRGWLQSESITLVIK
jgi:hypothetical protein